MKRIVFFLLVVICLRAHASREEVFVQANGTQLFCRVIGSGSPLIVIHGGPGLSQDYLLPHMEKLAENHQVLFYDQRGSGKSQVEENPEAISLDVFAQDLEALRKEWGFEKVSILGHSWGGLVAMKYAIDYPEAVDKLILLNSMMASSEDYALFGQEWNRRLAPFIQELDQIKSSREYANGDPDTVERFFRVLFRPYLAIGEKIDALNFRASIEANQKWIQIWDGFQRSLLSKSFDYLSDLKMLSCPSLVIQGERDVIPVWTSENLHQHISDSKFFLMKDCGHFPFVGKPEELFRLLEEFLEGG